MSTTSDLNLMPSGTAIAGHPNHLSIVLGVQPCAQESNAMDPRGYRIS